MEAMLPTLLYRFVGGGNQKYAIEVLELLQGLHKEWPPTVWLASNPSWKTAPVLTFCICQ